MADTKSKLHGNPSKRTLDIGDARIKRIRYWGAQKELKGTEFSKLDEIVNSLVDAQLEADKIPMVA